METKCLLCQGDLIAAGMVTGQGVSDITHLCPKCGIYFNGYGEAKSVVKGDRIIPIDDGNTN